MQEYKKVSLETINKGAAQEIFDECMSKVLSNIHDINTPVNAAREITLKFKIVPSDDRMQAAIKIESSLKLPNIKTNQGTILLTFQGNRPAAFVSTAKQLDFAPEPGTEDASSKQ